MHLVEHPEEINIEEKEENGELTLNVKLNEEDYGRVIGNQGKRIKAIRRIAKIPSFKNNQKVRIVLN